MKTFATTALAALALVVSGCGSDSSGGGDAGSAAGSAGNGMSVQEALLVGLDAPTLVTGYLIEDGGTLKLCESVMESEPPQCGEPSLTVAGGTLADQPRGELVDVRGLVKDGTIDVSAEG
ncbi:MAG: hypothetical protein H0T13_05600 [Actinobacteria bacterium]|nr:hypothetical protein [Actinomycetota bacterium]